MSFSGRYTGAPDCIAMTKRHSSVLAAVSLAFFGSACLAQAPATSVPAFPGAEGAGAMSIGGRGGRVIRVTNLNDSGPGSLRAAVEASGPRTVIFDIGGTIRLAKPLVVRNGRITIAGQTAPGGGITLRDQSLRVAADDVVIRFIRSRLGNESGVEADSIWVSSGRRVILDHVSASWSTDEALSVSSTYKRPQDDLRDVTVQWSIISESLCRRRGSEERHCYGSLVSGSRGAQISFVQNLWAHHLGRMPRPNNYLSMAQDPQGGSLEFRSNVFYNWGARHAGYNSGPASRISYSFVDNSYLRGPDSRGDVLFDERNPNASAAFEGNTLDGAAPDNWKHVEGGGKPGYRLGQARLFHSVRRKPAKRAFEEVLALAGASLSRDPVDRRVVESVRDRTGRLLDSQAEVGGWPLLAHGRPWIDSDRDGIPDDWERVRGLDARDPRDGNRIGPNGYTWLEEWLNALAAPAMAR